MLEKFDNNLDSDQKHLSLEEIDEYYGEILKVPLDLVKLYVTSQDGDFL